MSSILKALKKLEEEKSLFQEEKEINVSREILKQNSGNRNIVRALWLLGSSATIVIIILIAALLRKPSPKEAMQPGEPVIARQPAPSPLQVQKLPVSPGLTGSNKNISTPPAVVNDLNLKTAPHTPEQAGVNQVNKGKVPPANTPVPFAEPPTVVKAPPSQPTAASEQTLTLSGIAWNKDSADRLAIINGQPTATGATVNGVTVDEILPDRVKLSRNGRSFELLIGKNARTE